MRARWLELITLGVLASGCRAQPEETVGFPPRAIATRSAAPQTKPKLEPTPHRGLGDPLSGPPRLVIENHEQADVHLRELLIVDEAGEHGTQWLWPNPYDCPQQAAKLSVPARGSLSVEAPTRSVADGECTPTTPLPPGRYVVRVSSGYDSIYAAGTIALPLTAPVRLELKNHHAETVGCDAIKARRAARLGFAAVKQLPGLPKDFLQDCDSSSAVCGALPLTEGPPPAKCSVTLHEDLLVVAQPAGEDQLLGFRVWTDGPVSYVRQPRVSRSSTSRLRIDGQDVVLAGSDKHHRHMHGGAASRISWMQLRAYNPLSRELAYSVKGVEWLEDSDCGLPSTVSARPVLPGAVRGTLAPGQSVIDIRFATQHAYQVHCDRFASRVTLGVEGQSIAVTVEHQVTRVEPLRR